MTTELGNAREVPSQKKLALCAGACTISPRSALADAPHSLPFLITDWSRRLIPGSSMAWKIGQSGGKGGGKSGGRPFLLSLPKPLVSLPPVLSAPPKAHHPAAGGRDWPGGIKVPLGSELEPWLPHHAVQKGTFEPFFTEGTGYPRRSGLGIDVPRCPAETDGPCLFTQRRVATIQARLMDSMPGGLKGQAASNSGRGTHSQSQGQEEAGWETSQVPVLVTLCLLPSPKPPRPVLAHSGPFGPHLHVLQARRRRQSGEAEGRVGQAVRAVCQAVQEPRHRGSVLAARV